MAETISRGLTTGEIAMLQPYFGDSMKYNEVKVESSGFIINGAALSIGGSAYFNQGDFKADFSTSGLQDQVWFIHEMTHAWQSQQGYSVLLNELVLLTQGGTQYDYKLDPSNPASFNNYNMEQEADMIAHHYALTHALNDAELQKSIANADYNYLTQGENSNTLLQIVGEFMSSSHNSSWLPNSWSASDYTESHTPYTTAEKNIVSGIDISGNNDLQTEDPNNTFGSQYDSNGQSYFDNLLDTEYQLTKLYNAGNLNNIFYDYFTQQLSDYLVSAPIIDVPNLNDGYDGLLSLNPIGAFYESITPANDPSLSIANKTYVLLDSTNKGITASALAVKDTNADGKLTGTELSGLNMWRDLNENGIADSNLYTKGSNGRVYMNHQNFNTTRRVA